MCTKYININNDVNPLSYHIMYVRVSKLKSTARTNQRKGTRFRLVINTITKNKSKNKNNFPRISFIWNPKRGGRGES